MKKYLFLDVDVGLQNASYKNNSDTLHKAGESFGTIYWLQILFLINSFYGVQ